MLITPKKVNNCIDVFGKLIPAQDISIDESEYLFYCYIMFEDGDLWEVFIDWFVHNEIKVLTYQNWAHRKIGTYPIWDFEQRWSNWKAFIEAYDRKVKPTEIQSWGYF